MLFIKDSYGFPRCDTAEMFTGSAGALLGSLFPTLQASPPRILLRHSAIPGEPYFEEGSPEHICLTLEASNTPFPNDLVAPNAMGVAAGQSLRHIQRGLIHLWSRLADSQEALTNTDRSRIALESLQNWRHYTSQPLSINLIEAWLFQQDEVSTAAQKSVVTTLFDAITTRPDLVNSSSRNQEKTFPSFMGRKTIEGKFYKLAELQYDHLSFVERAVFAGKMPLLDFLHQEKKLLPYLSFIPSYPARSGILLRVIFGDNLTEMPAWLQESLLPGNPLNDEAGRWSLEALDKEESDSFVDYLVPRLSPQEFAWVDALRHCGTPLFFHDDMGNSAAMATAYRGLAQETDSFLAWQSPTLRVNCAGETLESIILQGESRRAGEIRDALSGMHRQYSNAIKDLVTAAIEKKGSVLTPAPVHLTPEQIFTAWVTQELVFINGWSKIVDLVEQQLEKKHPPYPTQALLEILSRHPFCEEAAPKKEVFDLQFGTMNDIDLGF